MKNRSVCLDVLAVDSEGRYYNIEVQTDLRGASPKRARYNLDSIDTHQLPAGKDTEELPDTLVIFITASDYFKKQHPVYHIDHILRETGERVDLGTGVVYFDASYQGDNDFGKLAHDLTCPDPDKMYSKDLAKPVRHFKSTERGTQEMQYVLDEMREQYLETGIQQGLQQGIQKGRKENQIEIAEKLLKNGKMSVQEISETTELPVDRVLEMQKKLLN